MSKWIPWVAGVITLMGGVGAWYITKSEQLTKEVETLSKQVKVEQAKTQAIVEEYNALKKIQDEGELKKKASQEKTNEAKASHAKSGSPVYASKHDAGLLRQRSLEVRGEATADTSKLD